MPIKIQEKAINNNEKKSVKSSIVSKLNGIKFRKKLPMSPAVWITTYPNLNPTPVNVTTPTIIPIEVAAAPTAKVFFAPLARHSSKSLRVSLFFFLINPMTTQAMIPFTAA